MAEQVSQMHAGPQQAPIFDGHFHIIDHQFPITSNNRFVPEPFGINDYREATKSLGIMGGAIVSGSFQGFDQSYLLAALEHLGSNFVGVTQIPATTSDEDILELAKAGVCAVRFNLRRGGSEQVAHLKSFAHRVFDLAGWHVELYVENRNLAELAPTLMSLPKVSIDHLGLTRDGFDILLRLVNHGVKVKATGFGRVDFPVGQAIQEIVSCNPTCLMFGTDLPSTRSPRPFTVEDLDLIAQVVEPSQLPLILSSNALKFYRAHDYLPG